MSRKCYQPYTGFVNLAKPSYYSSCCVADINYCTVAIIWIVIQNLLFVYKEVKTWEITEHWGLYCDHSTGVFL